MSNIMKNFLLILSVALLGAFSMSVNAYTKSLENTNEVVIVNEIELTQSDEMSKFATIEIGTPFTIEAEETVLGFVKDETNNIIDFILASDQSESKTTDNPTFADFYKYMTEINLPNKDVVIRQIIVHSGWDESRIKNNNVLRMKQPTHRATISSGPDENGYATYRGWKEAIDDYKLWQAHFHINHHTDMSSYIKDLTQIGYCENAAVYAKCLFEINTSRLAQALL